MTKFFITRHGETLWNTEKRMQGHKNSGLSALGLQQAEWLRERLLDVVIDAVYSSPCGRAMDTAAIITRDRSLNVTPHAGLIEIGLGQWEGRHVDEVTRLFPGQSHDFWFQPSAYIPTDGGETFAVVQKRVSDTLTELAEKHPDESILLVSHAVVLKTLLAFIEGVPLDDYWKRPFLTQASLSVAEAENGSFRLLTSDDVSHHQFVRKRNINTW